MTHRLSAPPSVMENIDRMKDIRELHGMTRKDIADLSGVSMEYIARFELGYRYPSRTNYNKLAKVFNWEEWY